VGEQFIVAAINLDTSLYYSTYPLTPHLLLSISLHGIA